MPLDWPLGSALLSATPETTGLPPRAKPPRRRFRYALATLAVLLAASGAALYFVWIDLEHSPNPWQSDIEEWKIPRGGPESAYVQQLLMACSLALAAVAASASELLVGLRWWRWPYQRLRFFSLEYTWVGAVLWVLILSSVAYLFVYEEYYELKSIYWPSGSYSYGDGYYYSEATTVSESDGQLGIGNSSGNGTDPGHHHHGPHHGPHHGGGGDGPREAKWVEALEGASREAGMVASRPTHSATLTPCTFARPCTAESRVHRVWRRSRWSRYLCSACRSRSRPRCGDSPASRTRKYTRRGLP